MSADQAACRCVLCLDPGVLDDVTQLTVEQVEKHGWQVTMIPADEQGPGWAYTVGLWHTYRIPELAMFGLDIELMRGILDNLGRLAVDGRVLEPDQERSDVATVPVVLKDVDYRWYKAFFGTAIDFYGRPPFPYLQVVWPTRGGAFPWQPGGAALFSHQPQLWLHPDSHPAGVWTEGL